MAPYLGEKNSGLIIFFKEVRRRRRRREEREREREEREQRKTGKWVISQCTRTRAKGGSKKATYPTLRLSRELPFLP
jgi:hypothetical protein